MTGVHFNMSKPPLRVCSRCYTFAITITQMPGPLAPFFYHDFKEKFLLVDNHIDCQNCINEIMRFGKCHCHEPLPVLEGME